MNISWENGSIITVKVVNEEVVISANKEGLLSLAKQLSQLAQQDQGSHIHYDKYNSLEEGSIDLIVEKV